MSNIAGEIYFIAEEPSVSTPPVRVKIGLVRESKKNRDSRDRLLDHQTGNPRSLVLLEAIKTARVSQVENSLHQRYASRRGIGEWFELTKPELTLAIAECHELAEQQSVHLPVIRKAESLKYALRNGVVIAASDESTEWHNRQQVAKASEELAEEFRTRLAEWNLEVGFDELHRFYLETRRPNSMWEEEKDLSTAYLKVLCGDNQGIEGICEWKSSVSRKFSAEIAEEQIPELVNAHEVIEVFGNPSYRLRSGDDTGD